jgi:hypothetical protein
MATTQSVHCIHVPKEHEAKHLHSHHHTPSASEVFLRTFRKETGLPFAPVCRSKEGESRVLVLYTGGTIGMMKNDKKGMRQVKDSSSTLILSSNDKVFPMHKHALLHEGVRGSGCIYLYLIGLGFS